MSKFFCSMCDKDVTLENGKCPICKADWSDFVDEESYVKNKLNKMEKEVEVVEVVEEKEEKVFNEKEDMITTYKWFIKNAKMSFDVCCFFAIVCFILAFIFIEDSDGASLFLIGVAVVILGYGIIFEKNLKWKGYMLKTNIDKSRK